jgi:hypothetical protein
MRKLLLAGLMGCLLVGSIPTGGRTDEPKALKRILDSALKAMGGEANLAKARAAHWRATGTYYAPGGPVSFTGEWWMQPPEQMKVVLEAGGPSKLSRVTLLDGNRGWITAGGNTQEMNEDQLAQAREELYHHEVTSLWSLRDPAFRLEMAGETKIEDRPAAGIKVTHAGHADITLYFDRQTGLLVKSTRTVKDPLSSTEVNQETLYKEYKDFGGLLHSRKITIRREEKDFVDVEVTDFKGLDKLDDSVFARPGG